MTELKSIDDAQLSGLKAISDQATTSIMLPDLGDDVTEGKVVNLLYSEGDRINKGDILLEVETDKVMLEIPADQGGTVARWLVGADDMVTPGLELVELITTDSIEQATPPCLEEVTSEHGHVKTDNAETEKRVSLNHNEIQTILPVPILEVPLPITRSTGSLIAAGPSARRLAREIGIDLSQVAGSGPRGRVSKGDVKAFARQLNRPSNNAPKRNMQMPARNLPDLSKYGPVSRQSLTTVDQATAHHMNQAWSDIPHAWLQEKIDITDLEAARQRVKSQVKEQGGSLTLTSLLAKAVAISIKKYTRFNSSLDVAKNELVHREYHDIGIAVDTEYGLVVPKIKAADIKSLTEISCELSLITEKAHARKLSKSDLEGAGITLSNLGSRGLTSIFPIINWPQVSILGVAASQIEPRFIEQEFQPRLMMPITLGFDHRVINGADGARFLQHLKQLLEDPFRILL